MPCDTLLYLTGTDRSVVLMNTEKPARPVNAVHRAVAILRLLGAADRAMTVTDIASTLDLVPSTALHILRTLAHENLVATDPGTKRYRLGGGTLDLARAYLEQPSLAQRFQPHLDRLALDHGVTALGIEWRGGASLTVTAIAYATTNFSVHANLGSRFPAFTSATGRCFAAFGDHALSMLETAFQQLEWENPPSFADWLTQVASARETGYAVDDSNYIDGVTALAVPVLGVSGKVVGAITLLALSGQVQRIGRQTLIDDLIAAGHALSSHSA